MHEVWRPVLGTSRGAALVQGPQPPPSCPPGSPPPRRACASLASCPTTHPTRTPHLRSQVDNRSSERFRSLEVRLVRHITLRASFGSPEYLKDAVVTQAMPGVDKYTTLQGGMAR